MRPVSEAFNRVIRGSHEIYVRAKVVTEFQTGTSPTGEEIGVEAGDVQLNARGEVRSTVDLTAVGVPWTNKPDGLLVPYGNEVFVERGVVYGNGDREIVSLGYHMVYSAESEDVKSSQPGAVRITAYDRMKKIIDARLTAPRAFYPGHTARQIFESIVYDVYPDGVIEYDFDPDAIAITSLMVCEESRYTFLRDVAAAWAKIIYFDHRGVLRVEAKPDPGSPVFEVNHGANGVLTKLSRSINREGVYNAVCARGESAAGDGATIQAVAYDNNPLSPTYWRGKFGKVPRFYSSPLLTTRTQCREAAFAILRGSVGVPYQVDFSMVPNPALEPNDPVRVLAPDRTEIHVIDGITIPLDAQAGDMSAATREQTNLMVGYEDAELS